MELEKLDVIKEVSQQEFVEDSPTPLENRENDTHELTENVEAFKPINEANEIVTDVEMTEGIADYLASLDEFKLENWSKLTLEERTEVLNKVEQQIAAIEHRPPLKVELEKMEPRHLGYQCTAQNKIALNSLYVMSNDPRMHREVLDTIVHEGRHAYQHYNVDVKLIHESGSEVATWRENFYEPRYQYYHSTGHKIMIPFSDGKRYDVDFRLYYYQPVEIDARNFSSDVLSKLEQRGVVCAKPNGN